MYDNYVCIIVHSIEYSIVCIVLYCILIIIISYISAPMYLIIDNVSASTIVMQLLGETTTN